MGWSNREISLVGTNHGSSKSMLVFFPKNPKARLLDYLLIFDPLVFNLF